MKKILIKSKLILDIFFLIFPYLCFIASQVYLLKCFAPKLYLIKENTSYYVGLLCLMALWNYNLISFLILQIKTVLCLYREENGHSSSKKEDF